jgi:hypothetical protein
MEGRFGATEEQGSLNACCGSPWLCPLGRLSSGVSHLRGRTA